MEAKSIRVPVNGSASRPRDVADAAGDREMRERLCRDILNQIRALDRDIEQTLLDRSSLVGAYRLMSAGL